jgi:hypothetical protein
MRRLRCGLVIGALAFVVTVLAAGAAAAAKGGNTDTAKRCQKGVADARVADAPAVQEPG